MISIIEFIAAVIAAAVISYGIDKMIEKDLTEYRNNSAPS